VKRSFSKQDAAALGLLASGTGLIAATYGLVRLAYGLFLPDVQADLGFGAATAGLISAGASIVYCIAAAAGFFLAARHPRLLVIAAALSASAGAAGMAASADTGVFAAAAIVGSAGAGLASPGLVSIIRRNLEPQRVDRGQAMVNAGTGPGLVAAGLLALLVLPDWRLAWFIVAAATLAIAAAVLVLDRGSGDGARMLRAGLPPGRWFRDHGRIILASLLLGAGSAAVWNYGRAHLVDAGASTATSVSAWIALGLGGSAVLATSRFSAALHPRTVWSGTTLVVAAASVALGVAPGSTPLALAACAAFGWGYTAATGSLIAWTARIDDGRAASGTSLLFIVLVLGQAIGATLIGALVGSVGSVAAFVVAAGLALAAAAIPVARRDRPAHTRPVRNRLEA
jgi:predicted MFS family arabinose efflux permease